MKYIENSIYLLRYSFDDTRTWRSHVTSRVWQYVSNSNDVAPPQQKHALRTHQHALHIMNILQLGALLQSRELTLQFLREKGLLYDAIFCSSCNRWMRHQRDASVKCDGYIFRCVTCRDKASIRRDSFFAAQRKDFSDYLTALYFFAKSIPACSAEKMMQGMMSQSTILSWYNYYRDLLSRDMIAHPLVVGGQGVIVEIDESMWRGKRKNNKGRALPKGGWVFGLFDRATRMVALFEIKDRTTDTLLKKITEHVAPGTHIYSDDWPAYRCLSKSGVWMHSVVNHSKHFVDPKTGTHTQNIESFWGNGKSNWTKMRGCKMGMRAAHIDEIQWRWNNRNEDTFESIITLIRQFYPLQHPSVSPALQQEKPALN